MTTTIHVGGDREYDVLVGRDLTAELPGLLPKAGQAAVCFAGPVRQHAEAGQGHSKLYRGQKLIEPLLDFLDRASPQSALFDQLLNASVAHAHHRELRRHKKRIGRHQKYQQDDPQQHQGNHVANLTPEAFIASLFTPKQV